MGIKRTVSTEIHCDICGEYIDDWCSTRTGVSIEWAKYYARLKGCTAGKLIDGTLNPGQFVPESLMWIQLLWFHSVFERGLASRD